MQPFKIIEKTPKRGQISMTFQKCTYSIDTTRLYRMQGLGICLTAQEKTQDHGHLPFQTREKRV